MMRGFRYITGVVLITMWSAASFADYRWEKILPPGPVTYSNFGSAYDTHREMTVFFGGSYDSDEMNETWEWDGSEWHYRVPETCPPPVWGPCMVYDEARQCTVLFGGRPVNGPYLNETWTWDGETWMKRFPATVPKGRGLAPMAYDPVRQRVVMYGGEPGTTGYDDTWEWDGVNWTRCYPEHNPGINIGGDIMVYFAKKSVMVLLLHYREDHQLWEWDGLNWSEVIPETNPVMRHGAALTYDYRNENVVMYGGVYRSDTWVWDGDTWTEMFPAYQMKERRYHQMVYDHARGYVLSLGGLEEENYAGRTGDMFSWDGTDWTPIHYPDRPRAVQFHAMAGGTDHGVIQFGGSLASQHYNEETWQYSGGEWRQIITAHHPGGRDQFSMAGNYIRNVVVLFGGKDENGYKADTWEFDGIDWVQKHPSNYPSGRTRFGLVYDEARQEVLLFGGYIGGHPNDETWGWDGTSWHRYYPDTVPPGLYNIGMAYDEIRQRVVMYAEDFEADSKTWEWDGGDWTGVDARPYNRGFGMMLYDRSREKILLTMLKEHVTFGTWEWDGSVWVKLESQITPPADYGTALAYCAAENRAIRFGGAGGANFSNTWSGSYYDPTPTQTPTITPTGTSTCTPTKTPTVTPTATPRCSTLGVRLWMPSHHYSPGDPCACKVFVCNPGPGSYFDVPLFVILDVYGLYFFAPSFGDFDYFPVDLIPGYKTIEALPEFPWPESAGDASGILWYAAMTDPEITQLFGEMDTWEFGWSENPADTPTPGEPTETATPGTPTATATPHPVPANFVEIPPGTYMIGSPDSEMCRYPDETRHEVTLIRGFHIQQTEVTQQQWMDIFGENPSQFEGPNHPVERVTWFDGCIFCNRLSLDAGLKPAYYIDAAFTEMFDGTPPVYNGTVFWDQDAGGYRLPTESEWEVACRAGTDTAYNNGQDNTDCHDDPALSPVAWFQHYSYIETHDVGLKDPNAWNLYDMHGNVWEWCWDFYDGYPPGNLTDPTGPESGTHRVKRGGCWSYWAWVCRSANRAYYPPGTRYDGLGFRAVRPQQ
jgi:formylglycine-generating enzyme required for sulfatase activity